MLAWVQEMEAFQDVEMCTENEMGIKCWPGYRKWKGFRMLEWVQDIGMGRGCCNGYRK